MILRTILFILLIAAVQMPVMAQSTNPQQATIRWNASGFTDQATNVTVQKPCQFIVYGSSKIEWVQKGGSLVYTFLVTSVSGTWTDVNTNGTLTYQVTLDGTSGSIQVSRSGNVTISLNLPLADNPIKNLYSISGFDIL